MTTIEPQVGSDIASYVSEVSTHLEGLPEEERNEMLEDLRNHLAEVALENPDKTLAEAVGSPSDYAAEMLASAGVPVSGTENSGDGGTRRSTLAVRKSWAEFRASALGRFLSETVPATAPAWWVLRAYIVVMALSKFLDGGVSSSSLVPQVLGSSELGVMITVLAILVSVALGRSELPPAARVAVHAGNLLAIIAGLLILSTFSNREYIYMPTQENVNGGCLTTSAGQRITNIYAYDVNGTLLDRTMLYDQDGRPLDNLCLDYDKSGSPLRTEYEKDVNGAPVYSVFPRRQWVGTPLPGFVPNHATDAPPMVEKPVTPPAVVLPRLSVSSPG